MRKEVILRYLEDNQVRLRKTGLVHLAFLMLGAVVLLPGPTLLDLQLQVRRYITEVNLVFPVAAAGYAAGCILSGFLVERMHPEVFLAGFTFLMGLSCAAAPWNAILGHLLLCVFVMNLAGGSVDAGGNYWIIRLWGGANGAHVQMAHFFFGMGGFLAPQVSQFFLAACPPGTQVTTGNGTMRETCEPDDFLRWDLEQFEAQRAETRIQWPYVMVGVVSAVATVGLLISHRQNPTTGANDDPNVCSSEPPPIGIFRRRVILVLIAAFCLGLSGVEIVFPRYLTSFAVLGLRTTKVIGNQMTSAYWLAYTFSRIAVVAVSWRWGHRVVLMINCTLMIGANVILWLSAVAVAGNTSGLTAFWVGVVLLGIGTSTVFPLLYSLLEETVRVRGWMTALITTVFALGEFIYPFIIGENLTTVPLTLIYVTTACSLMCSIFLAVIFLVSRPQTRPSGTRTTSIGCATNGGDVGGETISPMEEPREVVKRI